MIDLRIQVHGAKAIANAFLRKALRIQPELNLVVEKNAELLLRLIQANASGRPGPQVITGAYRASWHKERQSASSIAVTTSEPYAARLEYGFVGTDSLGRNYNQPPFPHVNPAANQIEGVFVNEVANTAVLGL